jgi:Inner membrane protein involved in colicin E2 resistance
METKKTIRKSISQSITVKALVIAGIILVLLIPRVMIENLIKERQGRSVETIDKINEKWSDAQTLCGPVLAIPYTTTHVEKDNQYYSEHVLYITPENLEIDTELSPEERYYGIYKTILYKSDTKIKGNFPAVSSIALENSTLHFQKARMIMSISDLRGVDEQMLFKVNDRGFKSEAGNESATWDKTLVAALDETVFNHLDEGIAFECNLNLKGSKSMSFIPIGSNTKVQMTGDWNSPSFTGNFSPEYDYTDTGFTAKWSVLSFNRSIPEYWSDNRSFDFSDARFGVNLIDQVDHYQQNMRSVKYSLMFIVLTFVVFFFVEIIYKKRIHPIQYLLVGVALILFYSLLLSISEQLSFGISYLISSVATILMITLYAYSIFKNKTQTAILTVLLCLLYTFLYITLQLEDIALLIGSIGLFIILGIIMYLSRKIKWYKDEDEASE